MSFEEYMHDCGVEQDSVEWLLCLNFLTQFRIQKLLKMDNDIMLVQVPLRLK